MSIEVKWSMVTVVWLLSERDSGDRGKVEHAYGSLVTEREG